MKTLFVAWQDPESRRWSPVARLTKEQGFYVFLYTRGAKDSSNFVPFGRMQDLDSIYVSDQLFPLFSNRILSKSRPEYRDYLRWLGLEAGAVQELDLLARSGGERATDSLEIFPCPEPTPDGRYSVYFFAHGLRYLSSDEYSRIKALTPGERLFLLKDLQNQVDPAALLLRTSKPSSLVGYCPRYFSGEFSLVMDMAGAPKVTVDVVRVNPDAPSQLRLLCKFEAPWPVDFSPCSREAYQPIADSIALSGDLVSYVRNAGPRQKSTS